MSERTVVWRGWPNATAPLGEIAAARRQGTVRVVDDLGRAVSFGLFSLAVEGLRVAWHALLRLDLHVFAALCSRRRSPPLADTKPGDGPVVIVLPVLPDLSHTFVYRELLAILEQRPDWRVVALAQNHQAPVHREAEALLGRVTFLQRYGITGWWSRAIRWLLRSRGSQLVSMYRAQPDAASRDLFDKHVLRDPRHPGNAFALADLLRHWSPRHVHCYSSTWPANVAMGAAHLLAVPFSISSYVDFEFPYSHKLLAEKVARATFFRVVTRFCRDRLRALHPELTEQRVPVVYLGLDLDNWQDRATPTGEGVLVSAARIVRKKGLHLMPPALAKLRQRGVAFRWRVLGDGDELPRIRELCAQHGVADAVELLGARSNADVREALRTADAAVLPCIVAEDGERDGIPIFFTEAMALGVPVVTTPISGIPELVRDGDTGFLCATGDVDSLADALQRVLDAPEAARAVGARGRDEVHRTLDVRESARQLIGCIER